MTFSAGEKSKAPSLDRMILRTKEVVALKMNRKVVETNVPVRDVKEAGASHFKILLLIPFNLLI